MKKIERITENDLTRIVKRILKEDENFSEYMKEVNVVGRAIAKELVVMIQICMLI